MILASLIFILVNVLLWKKIIKNNRSFDVSFLYFWFSVGSTHVYQSIGERQSNSLMYPLVLLIIVGLISMICLIISFSLFEMKNNYLIKKKQGE